MNLAIRGHETRGNEVIQILRILGGSNTFRHIGNNPRAIYYIDEKNFITCSETKNVCSYIIFTLEEFLEKYPYKVGGMARLSRSNIAVIIKAIKWKNDEIVYQLSGDDSGLWSVDNLKPYKEETMESNKCTYCVYAVNNNHCGLRGFRSNFNVNYCSAQNVDKLPNGFELQEDGYFSWVNEKPQYPKTYAECCRVVNANPYIMLTYDLSNGQKYSYDADNIELHNNFRRLKICRDAYWKIAGEQMGLNKPWEPDWENKENYKYGITTINGQVKTISTDVFNYFLIFPTIEIRDTFHENFKELIETCKELL